MSDSESRTLAALRRDAALTRLARARRWLIVGAAALSGGIAALVSAVAPGRSRGAVIAVHAGGSSLQMPSPAGPGELGLQGPAQPPQPLPQASASSSAPSGGAVSGGS